MGVEAVHAQRFASAPPRIDGAGLAVHDGATQRVFQPEWRRIFNEKQIKRDPFEQAVGKDQKTAMSIGGATSAPMSAYQYEWNLLPIGQQLALQYLKSYEEFPPLQAPALYNLCQVMEEIQAQKRAIHSMKGGGRPLLWKAVRQLLHQGETA